MIFYTDGSASPNPGPGGYAVINDKGVPVGLGGDKQTTNIRMEAMAIKTALTLAQNQPATIYTDSQFWISVLNDWAKKWQANNWKKRNGEIKNLELVKELFSAYQQSEATLVWVKAHNDNKYNELADEWANKARLGARLENNA